MKKVIITIVILFVVFVAAILIIGRTFYPDNIAETSTDGGAKGLKTRFYKTDLATAAKVAREVVPTLSTYGGSWRVIDIKDEDTVTTSKIGAEVPVVVFTDDLTATIKDMGNGDIQVDVRSQSRVGKSDFGENARHVRKLLNALDEKLDKQ